MRITGPGIWGEPADREVARSVVRRALELGVDFIDTADSYGPTISEEIIAEAAYPYPDGLKIATKAGLTRTGPNVWVAVGRPEYLRQQAELSLRRLKVDALDLFQLHRIDPSSEDVLDYATAHGIGFIPWAPVSAGSLARPGGAVDEAAKRLGASHAQVALAWLLQHSPVMLPIPGTGSVSHLEDNLGAAGLVLDAETIARLWTRRPDRLRPGRRVAQRSSPARQIDGAVPTCRLNRRQK